MIYDLGIYILLLKTLWNKIEISYSMQMSRTLQRAREIRQPQIHIAQLNRI